MKTSKNQTTRFPFNKNMNSNLSPNSCCTLNVTSLIQAYMLASSAPGLFLFPAGASGCCYLCFRSCLFFCCNLCPQIPNLSDKEVVDEAIHPQHQTRHSIFWVSSTAAQPLAECLSLNKFFLSFFCLGLLSPDAKTMSENIKVNV